MSNAQQLVQKLWNFCNILRDDGLSYGDYGEQRLCIEEEFGATVTANLQRTARLRHTARLRQAFSGDLAFSIS